MIRLIDDSNVSADEWGFTELRFSEPPQDGYKKWKFFTEINSPTLRGDGRWYEGEIHFVPCYGETIWSIENLVIFYLAEKAGYEVVTYGHKNLVPYLSLISHRCVYYEVNSDKDKEWAAQHGLNFFPITNAQNKFGDSFFHLTYNPNLLWWRGDQKLSFRRHDRFMGGYENVYFNYDRNLVGPTSYPHLELIEKLQYYPTSNELAEFYAQRQMCILSSQWDNCQTIINECPFWEEGKKYWFELKDNPFEDERYRWMASYFEKCIEDIIGKDTYLSHSSAIKGKRLQRWIWYNYPDSLLSFQLYCSIYLNMRFCLFGGGANFLTQIPLINKLCSFNYDNVLYKILDFSEMTNDIIFGEKSFGSYEREKKFDEFIKEVYI